MNRVYKVVWCHVRNIYVVASELASRKKIKGRSSGTVIAGAVLLGGLFALNPISAMGQSTLGQGDPVYDSNALISEWNCELLEGYIRY